MDEAIKAKDNTPEEGENVVTSAEVPTEEVPSVTLDELETMDMSTFEDPETEEDTPPCVEDH